MATDVRPDRDATVTTLVTGIISDAQTLFAQQMELVKHEIKEDLVKTKEASILFASGVGVGVVGGILLAFMAAYLLSWAVPNLPLWACFGIAGGVLMAISVILCLAGLSKFNSLNPWQGQSAKALKENVQWLTNPK